MIIITVCTCTLYRLFRGGRVGRIYHM